MASLPDAATAAAHFIPFTYAPPTTQAVPAGHLAFVEAAQLPPRGPYVGPILPRAGSVTAPAASPADGSGIPESNPWLRLRAAVYEGAFVAPAGPVSRVDFERGAAATAPSASSAAPGSSQRESHMSAGVGAVDGNHGAADPKKGPSRVIVRGVPAVAGAVMRARLGPWTAEAITAAVERESRVAIRISNEHQADICPLIEDRSRAPILPPPAPRKGAAAATAAAAAAAASTSTASVATSRRTECPFDGFRDRQVWDPVAFDAAATQLLEREKASLAAAAAASRARRGSASKPGASAAVSATAAASTAADAEPSSTAQAADSDSDASSEEESCALDVFQYRHSDQRYFRRYKGVRSKGRGRRVRAFLELHQTVPRNASSPQDLLPKGDEATLTLLHVAGYDWARARQLIKAARRAIAAAREARYIRAAGPEEAEEAGESGAKASAGSEEPASLTSPSSSSSAAALSWQSRPAAPINVEDDLLLDAQPHWTNLEVAAMEVAAELEGKRMINIHREMHKIIDLMQPESGGAEFLAEAKAVQAVVDAIAQEEEQRGDAAGSAQDLFAILDRINAVRTPRVRTLPLAGATPASLSAGIGACLERRRISVDDVTAMFFRYMRHLPTYADWRARVAFKGMPLVLLRENGALPKRQVWERTLLKPNTVGVAALDHLRRLCDFNMYDAREFSEMDFEYHTGDCSICGCGGDVILCCSCELSYHSSCLGADFSGPSHTDWACPSCEYRYPDPSLLFNVRQSLRDSEAIVDEQKELIFALRQNFRLSNASLMVRRLSQRLPFDAEPVFARIKEWAARDSHGEPISPEVAEMLSGAVDVPLGVGVGASAPASASSEASKKKSACKKEAPTASAPAAPAPAMDEDADVGEEDEDAADEEEERRLPTAGSLVAIKAAAKALALTRYPLPAPLPPIAEPKVIVAPPQSQQLLRLQLDLMLTIPRAKPGRKAKGEGGASARPGKRKRSLAGSSAGAGDGRRKKRKLLGDGTLTDEDAMGAAYGGDALSSMLQKRRGRPPRARIAAVAAAAAAAAEGVTGMDEHVDAVKALTAGAAVKDTNAAGDSDTSDFEAIVSESGSDGDDGSSGSEDDEEADSAGGDDEDEDADVEPKPKHAHEEDEDPDGEGITFLGMSSREASDTEGRI
jgi:hypothetical protein